MKFEKSAFQAMYVLLIFFSPFFFHIPSRICENFHVQSYILLLLFIIHYDKLAII